MHGTAATPERSRRSLRRRVAARTWVLVALAGVLLGYLTLYAYLYASVRWGDDVPLLAPSGTAGTVVGWLILAIPFVVLALSLYIARRVPVAAWLAVTMGALAIVAVIPHPPSIDCGNNITGFTCASGGTDPFQPR